MIQFEFAMMNLANFYITFHAHSKLCLRYLIILETVLYSIHLTCEFIK